MKTFLLKVWYGIVRSSENPDKYSLTIKGLGGITATIVLTAAGILHFTANVDDIHNIFDLITVAVKATWVAVAYVIAAASAWAAVYGAIRKAYLTAIGKNKATEVESG